MTNGTLLITGASSGIGAATARAAVAKGWKVGLMARNADKLQSLGAELGASAVVLQGDVTKEGDLAAAISDLSGHFGGLNAVFANAGLGATEPGTEAGDLANWREMLEVNIWGALLTAKLALPELRKTRGRFLVTGSRAGRAVIKGSVYGATKHFIHGWATNLAEEMRDWGGSCTIIAPGMVDTPFFDAEKPDGLRPEDVANAVTYALDQPATVAVGEVYVMPNPQGR